MDASSTAAAEQQSAPEKSSFLHRGMTVPFVLIVTCFAAWGLAGNLTDPLVSVFGSVFSMSVLDFLHLGSSLSLRSFGRVGSGLSVLDFLHLGSSLSLRSFGRVGSGLSVLDFLHLGSSLSLRSFALLALERKVPLAPTIFCDDAC